MYRLAAPIIFLVMIPGWHAAGQSWTRFRGPNGTGVSMATTVPVRWSERDYNWIAELPGSGHSSPVLWGERLFVTCGDGATGARILVCIDARSGQHIWSRRFPAAHHKIHDLNNFASATPAVDAQRLFVVWGTPSEVVVLAVDHEGQDVWRRDLGPFKASHGFGVSPMLYEDLVILPIQQQEEGMWAALDHQSGETRWRVTRQSQLHYATPCVYRRPGKRDELIFTNWEDGVCGVDPDNGRIKWNVDVFDKRHVESSIASPVVAGDLIIGTCGWLGYGNEVLAVRPPDGAERPGANPIWRIDRGAPLCSTPLVKEDLVFLWADNGIVTCARVTTGAILWQERIGGTYYSSPICVNGHLYNTSADGQVVVLAASEQFSLVARNELGQSSHATPAVADGVMYLRTLSRVFSIGGVK